MLKCRSKEERNAYIGRMLRIFRMLSGKTQKQMAAEMQMSCCSYQKMEERKRDMTFEDVDRIAAMFGIDGVVFLQHAGFYDTEQNIDYDMEQGREHEKRRALAMAEDLKPFGYVPQFQSELVRIGKRYGLTGEFKGCGILR